MRQAGAIAKIRDWNWPAIAFSITFGVTIAAYRLSLVMLALCIAILALPHGRNWFNKVAWPKIYDANARFMNITVWHWGAITLAYMLIACLWSPAPTGAALKVAALSGVCAAIWLIWRLAAKATPQHIQSLLTTAALAAGFAMMVASIDLVTNLSISRFFLSAYAGLAGADLESFRIQPVRWNRSMTLVTLVFFPILLAVALNRRAAAKHMPSILGSFFAIFTIIAVFASWKDTAKLALLAGGIAFLIAFASRKLGIIMAIAVWAAPLLLTIPAAQLANDANFEEVHAIPASGRARIAIWASYADEINSGSIFNTKRVFGHGADATRAGARMKTDYRFLKPGEADRLEVEASDVYRPVHTHNLSLQIWYEFGAVGVFLLCATGITMITGFRALDRTAFAVAVATMTTGTCTLNLTHQLWQGWYLGALGLAFAFFILAKRSVAKAPTPDETAA